ncbi:MAG: hypothetical protein IT382_12995, partial [Deltaproteobacteria bacterium]|nr:hypothetical protein [Deltaproteobacteria bacterium]
ARSGRACTSAHIAHWLSTFVNEARQAGSIGPPEGATPTGITGAGFEDPFSGEGQTAGGDVFATVPPTSHTVSPTEVTKRIEGIDAVDLKKKTGGA